MTPSTRRDDELTPLDDLHVALGIGGSFQTSIQHADTKAAILLTAQAGAAALVANNVRTAALALHAGPSACAVLVLLTALLVAGLAGSFWHLARCLQPRLLGPDGDNRFALAHLAARGMPPERAPVTEQRDEAWKLAVVLARIATSKHRAVRASLPWIGVTVVGASGWLWLTGAIAGVS